MQSGRRADGVKPVELLASGLDVANLVAWITSIEFSEWSQQHRVDHQLRPAMVTDLEWHGFGERTDAIVEWLQQRFAKAPTPIRYNAFHQSPLVETEEFNRMLSVVMPHHSIGAHSDAQEPNWLRRIHVPLTTNENAFMIAGGQRYHLAVGSAYLIDTRIEHAISNDGETPRIHFMFDVRTV
jgi:hypothetical protein